MEEKNIVSREEFQKGMSDMERKMDSGFANLEKSIMELKYIVEMDRKTDNQKYDDRYLLNDDFHQTLILGLAHPEVKNVIYSVTSDFLCSENGRMKFEHLANRYLDKKRDDISAWSAFWTKFVRVISIIALLAMIVYGGILNNQNNNILENQQKQLNKISEIIGG
ncbi:MAG: hypothetical protein RBT65_09840 [Methanolobus sp.]|nr:hypothetical protein [Methanolobus sp.]